MRKRKPSLPVSPSKSIRKYWPAATEAATEADTEAASVSSQDDVPLSERYAVKDEIGNEREASAVGVKEENPEGHANSVAEPPEDENGNTQECSDEEDSG